MRILGVETSSYLFSLCLKEDSTLLYEVRKKRAVSSTNRDARFFSEVKRLFEFAGGSVDAVAVCIGPGMFTSLRIGLSLAKAFALAHNVPVVGINNLDAIGIVSSFLSRPVLASINAYKKEIYAALYKNGKRYTDYLLTTPHEALTIITEKTYVIGSGIEVFENCMIMYKQRMIEFLRHDIFLPTASRIVDLAQARLSASDTDEPDMLEPFYIKKTDAERSIDKTNAV